MKSLKSLLKTGLLLSIPAFMLFSCSQAKTGEVQQEEKIQPIETLVLDETVISQDLDFTGTVQAWAENHLASSTPVRIEKILVDVGHRVKQGDLIALMDRTQLNQIKVQMQTLKNDLDRLDTLRKAGAATPQNYEQLKSQYDVVLSNYQYTLQNTEIRSPITGVVTGKYQNEGELFSMTPVAGGKAALVTVMQMNPVKVNIHVSERYYPIFKPGKKASVVSDLYPQQIFEGVVEKVYPTIDRATGTFQVEIKVQNAQELLRPGMFVRTAVNIGQNPAILVPTTAVLRQSGTNERFVFVEDNGVAIRKTVEPGRIRGDQTEVLQGLQKGDNLVISGQHNLLNQMKVKGVNN